MVQSQAVQSLTIGKLASAGGVGVETIRFYQRKGLIDQPARNDGIRRYGSDDLQRLRSWVLTEPQAPEGDWYKDFGSFVLCGTGEYPKTILKKGMKPFGTPL